MLIKILTTLILSAWINTADAQMLSMTVTAFTLSHAETGGRTQRTALMTTPVPGWSVAVSRDRLELLGKKVYIEGVGVRKIDSLTSKKLKNTLDILVGNKKDAMKMGRSQRRVVVL